MILKLLFAKRTEHTSMYPQSQVFGQQSKALKRLVRKGNEMRGERERMNETR